MQGRREKKIYPGSRLGITRREREREKREKRAYTRLSAQVMQSRREKRYTQVSAQILQKERKRREERVATWLRAQK